MARYIPDVPDNWLRWAARAGMAGGLMIFVARLRAVDVDVWHQMALFREALAVGWIPREDVFAYTPTVSPVIHHEWGTGALLYLTTVSTGLGAAGLMTLKYLLTAAIAAGCFVCALRRGADERVFAWLSVPAMALGWIGFTTIRAQVFTLLLLVILLLLLEEDRRGRRWWIAAWLPTYVVWLNLHAGFVVGAGVFGLYTIERLVCELRVQPRLRDAWRQVRHLFLTGLAMAPLLGVNPYGFDYVAYLWQGLSLPRPLITEWRPLWAQSSPAASLAVYGLSLAVVLYAVVARGVQRMPGLLAVAVTAVMAAQHLRHLSLYAVVWICYVPVYLEDTRLGDLMKGVWAGKARKAVLAAFWGLLAACGAASFVANRSWQLLIPTTAAEELEGLPIYPAGAVAYLAEQHFAGSVMVPFGDGAFVSWKLYPAVRVSFDSRYEAAYPPGAIEENAAFYEAQPGWQDVLDRYPTDLVLVRRTSPLDDLLAGEGGQSVEGGRPNWRPIYRDDGYSLYARPDVARGLPVVRHAGVPIRAKFP